MKMVCFIRKILFVTLACLPVSCEIICLGDGSYYDHQSKTKLHCDVACGQAAMKGCEKCCHVNDPGNTATVSEKKSKDGMSSETKLALGLTAGLGFVAVVIISALLYKLIMWRKERRSEREEGSLEMQPLSDVDGENLGHEGVLPMSEEETRSNYSQDDNESHYSGNEGATGGVLA